MLKSGKNPISVTLVTLALARDARNPALLLLLLLLDLSEFTWWFLSRLQVHVLTAGPPAFLMCKLPAVPGTANPLGTDVDVWQRQRERE